MSRTSVVYRGAGRVDPASHDSDLKSALAWVDGAGPFRLRIHSVRVQKRGKSIRNRACTKK